MGIFDFFTTDEAEYIESGEYFENMDKDDIEDFYEDAAEDD